MQRLTQRPLLVSTKTEVSSINEAQLAKLEGDAKMFEAKDHNPLNHRGFRIPIEEASQKLDRNTVIGRCLRLKPKSQVMLVKNLPDFNLFNGSCVLQRTRM